MIFCTVESKNKQVLVFARSGTVASKVPVHWGGDCPMSYESMAESLRGGLSLYSIWFLGHDIADLSITASPDL